VTTLTLRYHGDESASIKVKQKKDYAIVFSDVVQPGGVFSFVGTYRGTLGTEIKIYIDNQFDRSIHTSCSEPIGPGMFFGDFEVLAGESKNGGPLCPK
jgi:hypothetical protein